MSERRDLLARPAQGLKWLRARLADLLTAVGGAIAALAGLVWTLAPWLVFTALAAGIAALISTDARVWLTTQATRGWALVAGEQAGPPGFLYIEAPQVFTRERLVNDRFNQANWLNEQLERTGEDSFIESFSKPSHASQEVRRLVLRLMGSAGLAAPKEDETQTGAQAPALSPAEVSVDRLDLFDKVNDYRGTLRGELMDVQLDDGHDLDGNTLYRLNFNAVVAPFQDQASYPGSAVFLIRAKKPTPDPNSVQSTEDDSRDPLTEDDIELLHQLQREMQAFLTRVLEQRLEDFEQNSALENPTDPKEDLALDWFMRTRLVENFLTYLNDFPEQIGPYLEKKCNDQESKFAAEYKAKAEADGEETTAAVMKARVQEKIRNCRIDELSSLAGFTYRTDAPSPDMLPAHAAGFRRSIELAHLVNVAQWPKAGGGSYNARCAADLMSEMAQGNVNARGNRPPPGAGGPTPSPQAPLPDGTAGASHTKNPGPTEETTASRHVANAAPSDATAPTSATALVEGAQSGTGPVIPASDETGVEPDAKAPEAATRPTEPRDGPLGGPGPGAGPPFEIRVAQECLAPYEDPYRLRALTRLLSVTNDLRRRSLTMLAQSAEDEGAAEPQTATMKDEDAQNAVAEILRRFGEVLPKMEPGESDLNLGFTIADLETQVGMLLQNNGQLTELARRCEPVPEGVGTVEAAIAYARCRFLYAPSTNVRGLLAEFIVARVRGDLDRFYRQRPPSLNQFLNVTTDGCLLTDCRIRVDLNQNASGAVDEVLLATKLANALNERTNGLSVYEIAPRARTVIRRAGSAGDLSVGLSAPQGQASASTSRRDQTDYAKAVVLGFGQPPAPVGTPPEDAEAVFGWTVRAQQRPDGGWSSSHHRFSAVISAPSWWKRLDLEIHACWINPKAARAHGEALFAAPLNICATVYDKPPDASQQDASTQMTLGQPDHAGKAGYFKRSVRVQLPRSIDEVTARFNFDLVKTPYFDYAWKRDHDGASNALMAGRPAHIALAGDRLWRGTVVTIDGQPADRITVLPDMKGVIAEFRCVRPTPRVSTDASDRSRAKLTVWTAEGRTKPLEINVRPFEPVENANETPCYIQQARAGATDDDE